ncbi:MAG TPA: hypothetical protein VH062_31735 [Polyangiaceae bacterium]|nr:hypothetical protein [Polyangiaceae bacterium]
MGDLKEPLMKTGTEAKKTEPTNRDRLIAKQEFIDALVAGASSEKDLFGPEGAFTKLKGAHRAPDALGLWFGGRRFGGNGPRRHGQGNIQAPFVALQGGGGGFPYATVLTSLTSDKYAMFEHPQAAVESRSFRSTTPSPLRIASPA